MRPFSCLIRTVWPSATRISLILRSHAAQGATAIHGVRVPGPSPTISLYAVGRLHLALCGSWASGMAVLIALFSAGF